MALSDFQPPQNAGLLYAYSFPAFFGPDGAPLDPSVQVNMSALDFLGPYGLDSGVMIQIMNLVEQASDYFGETMLWWALYQTTKDNVVVPEQVCISDVLGSFAGSFPHAADLCITPPYAGQSIPYTAYYRIVWASLPKVSPMAAPQRAQAVSGQFGALDFSLADILTGVVTLAVVGGAMALILPALAGAGLGGPVGLLTVAVVSILATGSLLVVFNPQRGQEVLRSFSGVVSDVSHGTGLAPGDVIASTAVPVLALGAVMIAGVWFVANTGVSLPGNVQGNVTAPLPYGGAVSVGGGVGGAPQVVAPPPGRRRP